MSLNMIDNIRFDDMFLRTSQISFFVSVQMVRRNLKYLKYRMKPGHQNKLNIFQLQPVFGLQ